MKNKHEKRAQRIRSESGVRRGRPPARHKKKAVHSQSHDEALCKRIAEKIPGLQDSPMEKVRLALSPIPVSLADWVTTQRRLIAEENAAYADYPVMALVLVATSKILAEFKISAGEHKKAWVAKNGGQPPPNENTPAAVFFPLELALEAAEAKRHKRTKRLVALFAAVDAAKSEVGKILVAAPTPANDADGAGESGLIVRPKGTFQNRDDDE